MNVKRALDDLRTELQIYDGRSSDLALVAAAWTKFGPGAKILDKRDVTGRSMGVPRVAIRGGAHHDVACDAQAK